MARQVFSVNQINRYIKRLLESDAMLAGVFIEGEMSNVSIHGSSHIYFTLKDESAALSCVMFKSHAASLAFQPRNGMKVIIFGHVSLYEKTGQYQLYAEFMEPAGVGSLHTAFIQLRDTLQAEGLFETERKKPIPAYPSCIAVITSPTGAAVQDIIRVIKGRNPAVRIVIVPVLVQGAEAAADISRAINDVNQWGVPDIIILARGGGSIEDLWAFNEEATARAISASHIPVISAIGHETDFTIADFVSDLRAPTPTAAAVMAVYDWAETFAKVRYLYGEMQKNLRASLEKKKAELRLIKRSPVFTRPMERIYARQAHVQNLHKELTLFIKERLNAERVALVNKIRLLENISPYAVWRRGFTLAVNDRGETVKSVKHIKTGTRLSLRWLDGKAAVTVANVEDTVIENF